MASSPKSMMPKFAGTVFLVRNLPHVLDSHSRRLLNVSFASISPSPLQSKLSWSESKLTSPSMSGLMDQRFSSKSHDVNQYSKPSYIPSPSVSGMVGSVIPSTTSMKALGGSPCCQALKSFKRRLPRVSFEMRMLNTRCAFSVGCWKSPSTWSNGASLGWSTPLSGCSVARANSWRSIKPSSSPSKSPSPATSGFNVHVAADTFHAVKSNSTPSSIPSPSVSTLFGSAVSPVRLVWFSVRKSPKEAVVGMPGHCWSANATPMVVTNH